MGVPTVRKVQRTTVLEEKLQTLTRDAIPSKLHAIRCIPLKSITSTPKPPSPTQHRIRMVTAAKNFASAPPSTDLNFMKKLRCECRDHGVKPVPAELARSKLSNRTRQTMDWYATQQHTATLVIKIYVVRFVWWFFGSVSVGRVDFCWIFDFCIFLRIDQFKTDQKNIFLGSFWCSFWAKTNTAF